MTMNLDALERAAVAGTMKWRDAHSLVSLARKLLRLRSAARDFYNTTVANPNLRLSANDKKTRDEAMRAGERLRTLLESTVPGTGEQVGSDHYFNIATEAWSRVTDEAWSQEGLASAVEALVVAANAPVISANGAVNSRAQIIARAVQAHGRAWPEQLTSGVMFYEGERITKAEFLAEVRT